MPFPTVGDGIEQTRGSPVLHLRERLIRTRASSRTRMAEAERVALSTETWNAYRADQSMQLLVWCNRGATRAASDDRMRINIGKKLPPVSVRFTLSQYDNIVDAARKTNSSVLQV